MQDKESYRYEKSIDTILIVMIILTGLSLFLYPTVSNYISERNSSQAIERYSETVSGVPDEAELAKAQKYNAALYKNSIDSEPMSVSQSDYDNTLNITGDGMMAYINIPKINCRLPIYHGTDAETLESYIGHMPSSSLPVGGEGTHCVLTGHTGLSSAKLLTDLDSMEIGDRFTISALNMDLTYEVESITVVKPDETEAFRILSGQDLCTLVTCTPYGINTHRLLVRGHRVENAAPEVAEVSESFVDVLLNNPIMIALAALLVMLMLAYAVMRITCINRD